MQTELTNIITLAIATDEIGGVEDNDQYFYQKGFSSATVATAVALLKENTYRVEICVVGEQCAFARLLENGDGIHILPLDSNEGEILRLNRAPDTWLKAAHLEKDTGNEYIQYEDSCWLDMEVYYEDKKIGSYGDDFNSVFGSIQECMEAFSTADILQMEEPA